MHERADECRVLPFYIVKTGIPKTSVPHISQKSGIFDSFSLGRSLLARIFKQRTSLAFCGG